MMTNDDVYRAAYNAAIMAGLDENTADAVAQRVVERLTDGCNVARLINEEIAAHANP